MDKLLYNRVAENKLLSLRIPMRNESRHWLRRGFPVNDQLQHQQPLTCRTVVPLTGKVEGDFQRLLTGGAGDADCRRSLAAPHRIDSADMGIHSGDVGHLPAGWALVFDRHRGLQWKQQDLPAIVTRES